MNLTDALANGGKAVAATMLVTGALLGMFAGEQAQPVDNVIQPAFAPNADNNAIALELCLKQETQVTLVNSPQDRYYTAVYNGPDVRYDLTWRADGTAIAVEKLSNGRDFEAHAELLSDDFRRCVNAKPVTVKEAIH